MSLEQVYHQALLRSVGPDFDHPHYADAHVRDVFKAYNLSADATHTQGLLQDEDVQLMLYKKYNSSEEVERIRRYLYRFRQSTNKDEVPIEDIKAVPINTILAQYGLEPKRGFVKCPLHGEKTGSLKVYEHTNSWYCFGCAKGGSVIDLVIGLDNCSTKEAIDKLGSLL